MSKGQKKGIAQPAIESAQEALSKVAQPVLNTVNETLYGTTEQSKTAESGAKDKSKQSKKTIARNTDEFILKYAKKRFTPSNAGKAYLLSFLLDAYSMSETGVKTTLWNIDLLKSKIKTEEDIQSFDAYYYLTEWLRVLFEESRTMRKALRSVVSDYLHITTSVLAAENIRQRIIDTSITKKLHTLSGKEIREEMDNNPDTLLTLWLNTLTLEAYTPQSDGWTLLQSLRENIGEGLRYMVAYQTFLDVIAEFTGIPECAYLKINLSYLKDTLSSLNEALEALRDNVAAHREPEIREATVSAPGNSLKRIDFELSEKEFLPASLAHWTLDYLKATMRGFQPVEEPPPVPEERVYFLRDSIRRDFKRQYINWYVLWSRYSSRYRIPVPAVTPPTGRRKDRININIEISAHTEEGK